MLGMFKIKTKLLTKLTFNLNDFKCDCKSDYHYVLDCCSVSGDATTGDDIETAAAAITDVDDELETSKALEELPMVVDETYSFPPR